jgi:hypothetical protein
MAYWDVSRFSSLSEQLLSQVSWFSSVPQIYMCIWVCVCIYIYVCVCVHESYFKFMKNDIHVFPAGCSLLLYLTQQM